MAICSSVRAKCMSDLSRGAHAPPVADETILLRGRPRHVHLAIRARSRTANQIEGREVNLSGAADAWGIVVCSRGVPPLSRAKCRQFLRGASLHDVAMMPGEFWRQVSPAAAGQVPTHRGV